MLVLTRKKQQSIMVGDDIEISILDVVGDKVRIGIEAPREISVYRKEVFLEIHPPADATPSVEGAEVASEADHPA